MDLIAVAVSGLLSVLGLVFLVFALTFLLNRDFRVSTILIAVAIVTVISLLASVTINGVVLNALSRAAVPFGYGIGVPLLKSDLPTFFGHLIGIGINFLAFVGVVRTIQKQIDESNEREARRVSPGITARD